MVICLESFWSRARELTASREGGTLVPRDRVTSALGVTALPIDSFVHPKYRAAWRFGFRAGDHFLEAAPNQVVGNYSLCLSLNGTTGPFSMTVGQRAGGGGFAFKLFTV